jgi:PPOX class probable F420-dependent enzyme
MSRRDLIRMTDDEVEEFLQGRRTMAVASIGPTGRPHVVAMWYAFLDGAPAIWTYGKSQKVVNLRRDPRVTCLVEDGEEYSELRGVELVASARLVEDRDSVQRLGEAVYGRYFGGLDDAARQAVEMMGAKRLAVVFDVEQVVSWDHRKLGGAY